MKILSVGAELFHVEDRRTDRQTDMTNLIEDFRNFAAAPKNNDNHHNMRCNTQRNTHAVSSVRAVLSPAEKTEKRI